MSIFMTSIQHLTGSPGECNKTKKKKEKEIASIQIEKKEIKLLFADDRII